MFKELFEAKQFYIEFDYKNKHYKFKIHNSIGRYCFSDWNDYNTKAPEEFQKTLGGSNMSEYCAEPQGFKDTLRKRGALNVEITKL